jgi:hypothetical protein
LIKIPIVKFKLFRDQSEKQSCPRTQLRRLEALFIISFDSRGGSRFNRENSADHGHYTHDSIPEATISRLHDARHFWRPGQETFSGFIKARERPQKGGRTEGENTKEENREHERK